MGGIALTICGLGFAYGCTNHWQARLSVACMIAGVVSAYFGH